MGRHAGRDGVCRARFKEESGSFPAPIMTVTVIYGVLYVYRAIDVIQMLFNGKIPLLVKTTGPLPWLLLRG